MSSRCNRCSGPVPCARHLRIRVDDAAHRDAALAQSQAYLRDVTAATAYTIARKRGSR